LPDSRTCPLDYLFPLYCDLDHSLARSGGRGRVLNAGVALCGRFRAAKGVTMTDAGSAGEDLDRVEDRTDRSANDRAPHRGPGRFPDRTPDETDQTDKTDKTIRRIRQRFGHRIRHRAGSRPQVRTGPRTRPATELATKPETGLGTESTTGSTRRPVAAWTSTLTTRRITGSPNRSARSTEDGWWPRWSRS
jgi:hypothetical protein